MKKRFTIFCIFIVSAIAHAQTGPNLLGVFSYGINQYYGGDTIVTRIAGIPQNPNNLNYDYGYLNITPAPNGKFYGTQKYGGTNTSWGCLYEYTYGVGLTIKVTLTMNDTMGVYPEGVLLLANNGLLYGMSYAGGDNDGGTIFSYVPGDTSITKLVDFPYGALASGALIQASNGKLYGMTHGDGLFSSGTIFQYDISTHAYVDIYDLPQYAYASGRLLEVGADTLYGLTSNDGPNRAGTLFQYVISTGNYTVLKNLDADATPGSWLIHATDGKLYGTTVGSGTDSAGTIFSYDLRTSTYTDIYNFKGRNGDGAAPQGGVMQASNGILYGTTLGGGVYNPDEYIYGGTIFQYDIATSTYTLDFDLNAQITLFTGTGINPGAGSLTEYKPMAPLIIAPPGPVSICAGSLAVFSGVVQGASVFQWQVSTDGGNTYTSISGANAASYSFNATVAQNGYLYRAIYDNGMAADTSAPAALTVNASATKTITATTCPSPGYEVNNHWYHASGTFTQTIVGGAANGCDSVITLNLTVTGNDTATVNSNVCTALQSGATYQWVECGNYQQLQNGTGQSFTATSNGSYLCLITTGQCADTTNCVTVTGVGIDPVSDYSFALYPNPTTGAFTIGHNYNGVITVQIANVIGERLKSFTLAGNSTPIDISDLATGIYQVVITNGEQTLKVLKVVKE